MKTIPYCLECKQPISWGIHVFSQRLYGHSLCIKDQCVIGESGATARTVDIYLALKERNFPVVLGHFDGHKHIDIAVPGKLHIELNGVHQSTVVNDFYGYGINTYGKQNKIPTIFITDTSIHNQPSFAHVVDELSKACRATSLHLNECIISQTPPLTPAQLQ